MGWKMLPTSFFREKITDMNENGMLDKVFDRSIVLGSINVIHGLLRLLRPDILPTHAPRRAVFQYTPG